MKLFAGFDFSTAGLGAGLKRFIFSLLKTMAAAGIGYILLRLDNLHVANFVEPQYAGIAVATLAGIRGIFALIDEWLTTQKVETIVPTPSVTEIQG